MSAPLGTLNRWVTRPSFTTGLVGFGLAIGYGLATLNRPEGTTLWLGIISIVVVGVANVLGDRAEQQRLKTVGALARGTLARTEPNLAQGVIELSRLPESSFWINLGYWCGSAVLIGLLWSRVPGVAPQMAMRAAVVGIVCGPAVSVLTYLLVLLRCRQGISALAAAGLSPAALYRALPPTRARLSRQLLLFTLITVLTPLVFVIDLGLFNLDGVLAAAAASPDPRSAVGVFEAIDASNRVAFVALVALVLGLTLASAWWGGTALSGPIVALSEQTRAFAEGHLERTRVVPAEDEVWSAAVAFGTMAGQLDETVRRLGGAGLKLGTTVEELQASGQKHTVGGQEQRSALAHTSTTTEELARSARQVSTNAGHVADLAQKTVASAQVGKRSADAFYASIVQVREGNQTVADSVVRLNKRVQQVGRIVEFIDGIADRSDLLALNAELEGTKAGDVGRGFSLVAAEMRRLSESVMSSTREISRLIDEIRDATNAAVMATEAGVKATDVGKALAQRVSASFDSILEFANLTSDAVKSISLATQQQQAGTDQLAQAMGEILKSTDEGASTSRAMAVANDDLATLARELKSAVERVGVR